MEMPDVIYADLDLGSEDPETPYFAGEYKDGEPVSGKYHHDRIKEQDDATIESLRRENKELKAKLDKAKDALRFYADVNGYECKEIYIEGYGETWIDEDVVQDHGHRARTTLEDIE